MAKKASSKRTQATNKSRQATPKQTLARALSKAGSDFDAAVSKKPYDKAGRGERAFKKRAAVSKARMKYENKTGEPANKVRGKHIHSVEPGYLSPRGKAPKVTWKKMTKPKRSSNEGAKMTKPKSSPVIRKPRKKK